MLNNTEENEDNDHNEIDRMFVEMIPVIGDTYDKVEINDFKLNLIDKYNFFKMLPITLIFVGSASCGKSSVIINTIKAIQRAELILT